MKNRGHYQRGIILLFCLGILSVLFGLGIIYTSLSVRESATSQSYNLYLSARWAAQSGLEYALAHLDAANSTYPFQSTSTGEPPWYYYGEDKNQNGVLDPGEDTLPNGVLDTQSCPLELALRPSFPSSLQIPIEDRRAYVSGMLTSSPLAQVFLLKIEDTSGLVWINDPNEETLKILLEHLGRILNLPESTASQILSYRHKVGTIASLVELTSVLEKSTAEKISPYLTAVGKSFSPGFESLAPTPLSERTYKVGQTIFSRYELVPSRVRLVQRTPIHLNTAPTAVIEAALQGLEAVVLKPLHYNFFDFEASLLPSPDQGGKKILRMSEWLSARQKELQKKSISESSIPLGTIALIHLSDEKAHAVAEYLSGKRFLPPSTPPFQNTPRVSQPLQRPVFKNFSDFRAFLNRLVVHGVLSPDEAALIEANADLNARLNKFNPDEDRRPLVDKSDLTQATTEFTFVPNGLFHVESLGLVLTPQGKIMAKSLISNAVDMQTLLYQSTQADFEQGMISPATDQNASPTANGKTLQLYPQSDLVQNPSPTKAVDGYMRLSTVSEALPLNKTVPPLLQNPQENPVPTFYAGFNQSISAEIALGDPHLKNLPPSKIGNIPLFSLVPLPDGAFSDERYPLTFEAPGNVPAHTPSNPQCQTKIRVRTPQGIIITYDLSSLFKEATCAYESKGTLSFWVKPAFDTQTNNSIRTFFSLNKTFAQRERFNQLLYLPISHLNPLSGYSLGSLTWVWEHPTPLEYVIPSQNYNPFQPGQWHHVALSWNTTASGNNLGEGARLYLDGQNVTPALWQKYQSPIRYGGYDFVTKNQFAFGCNHSPGEELPPGEKNSSPCLFNGADATFDEILITDGNRSDQDINQEFKRGRYYQGTNTVYESPLFGNIQGIKAVYVGWTHPFSERDVSLNLELLDGGTGKTFFKGTVPPHGWLVIPQEKTKPTPLINGFKYRLSLLLSTSLQKHPLLQSPVIEDVLLIAAPPRNKAHTLQYIESP